MKQKCWFLLVLFNLLLVLPLVNASVIPTTQNFWEYFSNGNYDQALSLCLELGETNPIYFELGFYLGAVNFTSTHQLHQINQAMQGGAINQEDMIAFEADLNQYLPPTASEHMLVKAIIEYNESNNPTAAKQLVTQALAEKKTALGYYLQYAFQEDVNGLKNAVELSNRPAFMKMLQLILDYNQGNTESFLPEIQALLGSDAYYFDKEDYLNLITMGLGQRFSGGVGPSGPNGEPYFGELCMVTGWEEFKSFSPRHQILFTFTVGGPGGQNTHDAEKLLELISDDVQQQYAPFVTMLRIYENFHNYQYEAVYQGADELLKLNLTDPSYFAYVYDLAYEYEMFYFTGYHPEPKMIEKSVFLYELAYKLAPQWSSFWKEGVLQGKGRSQFYAKQYLASINTLKQALEFSDDPLCYLFLSLDYYAIGDVENGAYWENLTRIIFSGNDPILKDYDNLLVGIKQ